MTTAGPDRVDARAGAAPDVRGSILHLAERFRAHEADGLEATWVLRLTDRGAYTLRVRDGDCSVTPGGTREPDAELTMDSATWLDLVVGRVDGIAAFTQGRLAVSGDLNLAIRLETLFLPGAESQRFLRVTRTDARGIAIEAVVAGRGAPVLLLHGLAASKVSFLPTLDGLADRYEVHALDLPGFGKSDKPLPAGRRYSPRWMADVVADYLRTNGIRSAYVVGNSMGGRVGVELALRHPRKVAGVVGLGSAVAFDEWQWLGPTLRLLRSQWIGLAPFPMRRQWVETGLADLFHDPNCIPSSNFDAAVEEFLRSTRDHRARLAMLACLRHLGSERATGRRSFWRQLEGLRVPSYWVWGASDQLSSHRYGDRVSATLPDARVEVWDDIGHVPQFEDIERTNAAVGGFLDDLEATRT